MAQQPFKDWKTFADQIELLVQRGMGGLSLADLSAWQLWKNQA